MSHESRVWQIKKHIMAKLAPNLPPSNLVSLVLSLKTEPPIRRSQSILLILAGPTV